MSAFSHKPWGTERIPSGPAFILACAVATVAAAPVGANDSSTPEPVEEVAGTPIDEQQEQAQGEPWLDLSPTVRVAASSVSAALVAISASFSGVMLGFLAAGFLAQSYDEAALYGGLVATATTATTALGVGLVTAVFTSPLRAAVAGAAAGAGVGLVWLGAMYVTLQTQHVNPLPTAAAVALSFGGPALLAGAVGALAGAAAVPWGREPGADDDDDELE